MADLTGRHAPRTNSPPAVPGPRCAPVRLRGRVVGISLLLSGMSSTHAAEGVANYPVAPGYERAPQLVPPDTRPGPPPMRLAANGANEIARSSADAKPRASRFYFENEIEVLSHNLRNIALGQQPGDDQRISERELQLQLRYRSGQRVSGLGEVKLIDEQKVYDDARPNESESEIERGETWVHFARLFGAGIALRVGRQNFAEPRRWWWDDDLDAARFYYKRDPIRLSVGIAEELARESSEDNFIDPDQDDVRRLFGQASWRLSDSLVLDAFYLGQRDDSSRHTVGSVIDAEREDESDADLRWAGLRAWGDFSLSSGAVLSYWVDAARVSGDEIVFEFEEESPGRSLVDSTRRQKVRGKAVDLGLIWAPVLWGNPTLTLSYARGSGDGNPDDDTDEEYRQTGLQDQDEEFRNYGELLRPELSNLSVHTLAIGLALRGRTRIGLGHHRFRQVDRAPFLRSARLETDPTGLDKDIGRENRVLLEIREWKKIEIDLAAAEFKAGRAFGTDAGARAHVVFGEFTFKF